MQHLVTAIKFKEENLTNISICNHPKRKGLHCLHLPWAMTLVADALAPVMEQGFEKSMLEGDEEVAD